MRSFYVFGNTSSRMLLVNLSMDGTMEKTKSHLVIPARDSRKTRFKSGDEKSVGMSFPRKRESRGKGLDPRLRGGDETVFLGFAAMQEPIIHRGDAQELTDLLTVYPAPPLHSRGHAWRRRQADGGLCNRARGDGFLLRTPGPCAAGTVCCRAGRSTRRPPRHR